MTTSPDYWSSLFHRAAKEPIGIAILVDDIEPARLRFHQSRPPGFENYSVALTDLPNVIFIVREGVTLDD